MNLLKVYTPIVIIELSNDNEVSYVEQFMHNVTYRKAFNERFSYDLERYFGYDIERACNAYNLTFSEEECLRVSENAPVIGYDNGFGKYSGMTLRELPDELKNQVSKMVRPIFLKI